MPVNSTNDPTPEPVLRDHLRADLFRALSDPTRLEVLARLVTASVPQTVTEISGCCGVHLSGVSRHLAMLREAGVVRAERVGREARYSLERDAVTTALRGLADAIDECRARCAATEASDATDETGAACCPEPTDPKEAES